MPERVLTVVGVGCSAGGLEALKAFFGSVPADSPLAFLVVQHLDPTQASHLPELLQLDCRLPVQEAAEGQAVEAGHVYVVPPDRDMALSGHVLHLSRPEAPRGLRLPVDHLFRSLAAAHGDRAIGVVLSGMGADGTQGLLAIQAGGGLTLVQDPDTASADGMPRSAVDAGAADVVAPANALAARIDAARAGPAGPPVEASPQVRPAQLEQLLVALRDRTGHDFHPYKASSVMRRVERRITLHQLGSLSAYLHHVEANPQELDLLFKELLIGVTHFFRDPEVWAVLRDAVWPELLARHAGTRPLRAWVPGCSTGEEAYSLAITYREALAVVRPRLRPPLQVFATDLDADAIAKARKGLYPESIAADVDPDRLARHFVHEQDGYRVSKDVRDMVVFAAQNIVSDPPFTKLDLLSCRNLLIYLGSQAQKTLLPVFHYALNEGGYLVLGTAETVGHFGTLFTPLEPKLRVYRRLGGPGSLAGLALSARRLVHPGTMDMPSSAAPTEGLEHQVDHYIQQHLAPPAVLVSPDGDILYISGRTGKYLEPAAGKVNVNLHAMAREGLREALPGAIRHALQQGEPVQLGGLTVRAEHGTQAVDVTLIPLRSPEALMGKVLVVFQDVAAPPRGAARRRRAAAAGDADLAQALEQARQALQVAHEEAQASVEEYRSANEELQSTNEELQSANEELTTSKEELQSLNEELQTVNAELQSKVDELTAMRNDMTNLLNSTEIATVFLDNQLRLRRFTAHATHLFKLIPGDVGRSLADIVSALDYGQLEADTREVLRTLVFVEKVLSTHDGRWYRVRIMPYRTLDNLIDGVVMTFIDVTEIKRLEADLGRSRSA